MVRGKLVPATAAVFVLALAGCGNPVRWAAKQTVEQTKEDVSEGLNLEKTKVELKEKITGLEKKVEEQREEIRSLEKRLAEATKACPK
ncbi:MAG TPA: hypothetical protein VNX25_08905 [Verrucomicrobiae bacterium]|nr:hypothetical protein [Verrucomicrobiae bacterium]